MGKHPVIYGSSKFSYRIECVILFFFEGTLLMHKKSEKDEEELPNVANECNQWQTNYLKINTLTMKALGCWVKA